MRISSLLRPAAHGPEVGIAKTRGRFEPVSERAIEADMSEPDQPEDSRRRRRTRTERENASGKNRGVQPIVGRGADLGPPR